MLFLRWEKWVPILRETSSSEHDAPATARARACTDVGEEPAALDVVEDLAMLVNSYEHKLRLAAAPLAVTQPVTFLQLIWATLLGVLVFGEPADGFVMLGGSLIIAAISVVTWREARRKAPAPAQGDTPVA